MIFFNADEYKSRTDIQYKLRCSNLVIISMLLIFINDFMHM